MLSLRWQIFRDRSYLICLELLLKVKNKLGKMGT